MNVCTFFVNKSTSSGFVSVNDFFTLNKSTAQTVRLGCQKQHVQKPDTCEVLQSVISENTVSVSISNFKEIMTSELNSTTVAL